METPSIDESCRRRFEEAWLQGAPLPIEECLPSAGEAHWLATLEELVAIELELGWKHRPADGPKLETYFDRFPELRQPAIAGRLVQQEYEVRLEFGDRPTLASYQQRFPDGPWPTAQLDDTAEESPRTPGDSATEVSPGLLKSPHAGAGQVMLETIETASDSRGRYALSRLHAEGGLGRVWVARDPVLNREVALKELKPSPGRHPEAWQRFLKEAQVTGQLEHPNIVPVYEFGWRGEGSKPFYTMRLIRGQTLRQVVAELHRRRGEGKEEPLERMRLLHSFVSICNAISFAHSRGVIHRDLKPENVIVGGFGEVLVLDWGLARTTAPAGSDSPGVELSESIDVQATVSGHILGTPAYMSPEQAEGNIERIDQRTDVYGLGAILFEILAGRPPHQGSDSATLIERIVHGPTPRARDVVATAPKALDAICAHAMAKKPEDRYPSAIELARDVERYLADEPVSVYREPLTVRAGRFVRRHRTAVSVATASLLFILAGAIVGLFLWQAARDERRAQLLSLETSLTGGETTAVNEVKQGHYKIASSLLASLKQRADAEADLPAGLQQRLAAEAERAARIADFYRLSDLSERNEFFEYDDLAEDQCDAALRRLGVFNQADWPAHLPDSDLAKPQRDQLREDAFRELILLASLHAKRGLLSFGKPEAAAGFRRALELIEVSRRLRPSQSAQTLESFCHIGLGQLTSLRLRAAIEPTCAADFYFVGLIYLWIGGSSPDDPVTVALNMVKPLTGLDFSDSKIKSESLLRLAAAAEPRQYWSNFMLGWAKLLSEDYVGAELVFDTCIAVRGDSAIGYCYRGFAVLKQASDDSTPEENARLHARGLADMARARQIEPTNSEIVWLHSVGLQFVDQTNEALAAYLRAVELEPPLKTWDGRRVQLDKKTYLNLMLKLATETTEADAENAAAWRAKAAAAWMLGDTPQADAAATRALVLQPGDPWALSIRGDLSRSRGAFASAAADFQTALKAAPKLWVAASGLAAVHENQAAPAQTLADNDLLLAIAETDWQKVAAHLGRARALRQLGRTRQVNEALAAARAIDARATEHGKDSTQ